MILGVSIIAGLAACLLVLAVLVIREERKQKVLSYLQRDLLIRREDGGEKEILCRVGCSSIIEKEARRVEGTGLEVSDVLLAKVFGALSIVVVFTLGGWWLLGIILAGIYVYSVNFLLEKKKQARRKLIESQAFIDFLLNLASTLNIVPGFLEALEATIPKADEKIRPELERIVEEHRAGMSLGEALMNFAARNASPTVAAWVEGIILAREHGGNLAEVCMQAAEKLRLKKRIEKEIRAAAMNAKATVVGISGVLLMVTLGQLASGQFDPVLKSALGRVALSLVVSTFIIGSFVVYNMIEKEARL